MNRPVSRVLSLVAAAAAAMLAALPASSATLEPGLKLLWDQRDAGGSVLGVVSQNFETTFDAYDCQGADDFVVPDGETWLLKAIEVIGTHFAGIGPLRSMHATVYGNSDVRHGRPGQVVSDVFEAHVEAIGCEGCGSYLVHLPEPVALKTGRHWLALQGNMSFTDSGEWGWGASLTQRGKPSLWRNPGGGFGLGCTQYQKQVRCIGDFGQGPDYQFALHGQRRGP